MRKIMMFNRITPEGYFSDPTGGLGWAVPDSELEQNGVKNSGRFDTILLGRRTYQMFASFWPQLGADGATAPDPHAPGRHSSALQAMATFLNQSDKLVFSRTLERGTWNPTRVLDHFDADEFRAMKAGPGKDIILFGSGSIVTVLSEHALIDEYQFVMSPLLLGRGEPLFKDRTAKLDLELVESRAYPTTGNVLLRYTLRR